MNLKDLYAKARILRLALANEYDLVSKQEIETRYKEVMGKIEDIINSAPF
jgi:L-serine deaminase